MEQTTGGIACNANAVVGGCSLQSRVWVLLNDEHWIWPSFGVNHTVRLTLQGQAITMRTVRQQLCVPAWQRELCYASSGLSCCLHACACFCVYTVCASVQVVESPRLFYISNFISKAEAEHIKLTAEPRMTRSQVPARDTKPNNGGYANEAVSDPTDGIRELEVSLILYSYF